MITNENEIALKVVEALRDPSFTTQPGECQKFVREVVEQCGDAEDVAVMDAHRGATAKQTMLNFANTSFAIWSRVGVGGHPPEGVVKAGLIVYKGSATSGPDGHTGIAFHNIIDGKSVLCIGENSSRHIRNPGIFHNQAQTQGAKGWIVFDPDFGPIEMVVEV